MIEIVPGASAVNPLSVAVHDAVAPGANVTASPVTSGEQTGAVSVRPDADGAAR